MSDNVNEYPIVESSESSLGTKTAQPQILIHRIKTLFSVASDETFEEGMDSHFSKSLTSIIEQYGDTAVAVSSDISVRPETNSEVAYEAMRLFGRIDHLSTHKKRMGALIRGLQHPLPRVRDGAALGLASMDDPQAIPALREAIQQEPCEELREDMEQANPDHGRGSTVPGGYTSDKSDRRQALFGL